MNINLRKCPALICTALLAASLTTGAFAKEENAAAAGSIRPAGKIKPADLPTLARISFDEALKAALIAAPGKIIKAELEIEDGNLMYSFEIVGAGKAITEVEIDAGNGKVLGTDEGDPEEREESNGK
jgi:uncharacterized membrane protein YkoI